MNEYYIKLTKCDKMILESYHSILDGFANFLGPGFEFVLHSLENLDQSAVKVINGHFSGRKEGAPITDLALQMLAEIKNSGDNHKNMIYTGRSKNGSPLRSATFPIIGEENRIIGLICVNFYMDIPLYTALETFLNTESLDAEESFVSNSDELLDAAIESAKAEIDSNPQISFANRNKEIVLLLDQKGVFHFKDSVRRVASNLKISKNTVYLHLRNQNNKKK